MATLQQFRKKRRRYQISYAFEHRNKQTKKYCRFKKSGIKYIDYKDADFLLKLLMSKENSSSSFNRTSLKYQRKFQLL
jgi:small subunit ribosomal protein S18